MVCPAWEDCNKKSCIEQSVCMNGDYWDDYWKEMAELADEQRKTLPMVKKSNSQIKVEKGIANSTLVYQGHPLCTKSGDICDKHEACRVLDQCVVTLSRVVNNPMLLEAMRGPHSLKSIINLLKHFDPTPMRSYYLLANKKM